MSGYWFALLLVVVVLLTILQLLRRRRLREKYAITWIAVGITVAVLAVVPGVLTAVAGWVGIATPVNLLFALGGAALLIVCIQYSVEISVLEAETRTLAEEAALLRHEVLRLSDRLDEAIGQSVVEQPPADADPSDASG